MRPISSVQLDRWRALDAEVVLVALADYAKRDGSYAPRKNSSSTRWHATVGSLDFELLLTGAKFWDTRENRGGCGALDLVMHLNRCDFRRAVTVLKRNQAIMSVS